MKKKSLTFGALCLLAAAFPCVADTFLLKDGTTHKGAIISETGDSYILEIQVTKSIKDDRKIAKSDVAKITRVMPDEVAFEVIAQLLPTPDLLVADDYDAKIALVEKFVKEYGDSSKLANAMAILATLKSEYQEVAAGGIKLNGVILKPQERQANAYDIDARVMDARIRGLVDANELLQSLRLFAEFDRDYRQTLSYGALASLMRQVIRAHHAETKLLLQTFDSRTKESAAGVQRMNFADRKITQGAIKEEAALIDARYKAEKDAKQDWVTVSPFHKASLEDTVRFCEQELTRLAAVQAVPRVDGGKVYRDLWAAVQDGNSASFAVTLTAAKTADVPDRYLAPLEAAAKNIK